MSEKPLTPAMAQWRQVKDQHPDKLVFFRLGDFYELFHDDAVEAARLLDLTLTSRSKGENAIPMAGVPHHAIERYLKDLLDRGRKAVLVDQLEEAAEAKGLVKRGVSRVITPGTVVEDGCLEARVPNWLAAVCGDGEEAGLAWADVSTGEFRVALLPVGAALDELERLAPAETLLPGPIRERASAWAERLRGRNVGAATPRPPHEFDAGEGETQLKAQFAVASLDGFGLADAPAAVGAAGAVLRYLRETQRGLAHLRSLIRVRRDGFLVLDRTTQRNLELVQPLQSGAKGATLLGVLDRTRTGPGARLLRQWILAPLAEAGPIRSRQEAVGELMEDHGARAGLRELLGGMADLERIQARIATARATARDLAALGRSAGLLPSLAELGDGLRAPRLRELSAGIDRLEDLAELLHRSLVDEPPVGLKEGGLIRDGIHPELDEMRAIARGGKDWIARFQTEEQARTGIPSLKVGFNRVFGYYLEITHVHRERVPADYERKQTLVNAERYVTPGLKEYERKVLGAEERISSLEYELFCGLRERAAAETERVQRTARALAELDCLSALAEGAAARGHVLPEIHEGLETTILEGRHPVVETLLPPGAFIPNDLVFDPVSARVLILTGPNMAGKSTYIRQAALLVLLAQMGAAVPATSARIGLTDRIFTRVGAADDLARGQSTFFVEMAETANILHNATERSLVILDEVGRGTSTFDGVSLAWAVTEHLHHRVQARALFATHYHELAELGFILDRAKNFNVAVRDWGGEIVFLRKIVPGGCDRSYGIHVARLAGIPGPVIERAREILAGLEAQAADRDASYLKQGEVLRAAAREVQLDLFAPARNAAADAFRASVAAIDPESLSPREAHERLRDLIEQARTPAP